MKSIRSKLIIGICSITLGICVLLASVNLLLLNSTARQGMSANAHTAAVAYSNSIAGTIRNYMQKAEELAKDERIRPNLQVEDLKKLAGELAKDTSFSIISFVSAKGVPYDAPTISLTDREYFQHAIAGETYISSPIVKKTDSSVVLYVAAKVHNDAYDGILIAELPSDVFSKHMENVTIGEKGYGYITDKTGTCVAHKDNEVVKSFTNFINMAKEDPAYSELGSFMQTMIEQKSGEGQYTFDGSKRFVAYEPVENTDGWVLGIAADEQEMMSSLTNGLYISGILTAVAMAVSISFALLFANSVGKPISLVTRRLELLSGGDLKTLVPVVKAKDETAVLASSLAKTTQALSSYIQDIHQVLAGISAKNLDVSTRQAYIGDFMDIKTDMDGIIGSLNNTIRQIATASEQVASGADQVSNSSMGLSQGATEQASSIEQLTASLQAIAAKTALNAQNAKRASELSVNAKQGAEQGSSRMDAMLGAMDAIQISSGNIQKIIKVIDEIAFQTNILALNAAIEAARAGQHGKGFAVVADEVRTLAAKSAEAVSETTHMIAESDRNVKEGIQIASDTAQALQKIVSEVTNAAELVGSIAEASDEQATGIEQLTEGINQVSRVVQSNAATSEESAAASQELASQADLLKEIVRVFKVKQEENGSPNKAVYSLQKETQADAATTRGYLGKY